MTQRQISHGGELPPCAEGHPARHIHALRAAHAGGGHFIECACRNTARHPDFESAAAAWCQSLRLRVPKWVSREREDVNVLQFVLPLGSQKR